MIPNYSREEVKDGVGLYEEDSSDEVIKVVEYKRYIENENIAGSLLY